ncbi:MAG: tetratricopeptide repeat protein [Bdellovibrionota bacterium]
MVGCSAAKVSQEDTLREEINNAAKNTTQTTAAISALTARIDSLETKLNAMNDKVTAVKAFSPTLPDEDSSYAIKPKITQVTPHPATGIGVSPKHMELDSGFINDEAIQSYRKAMILFQAKRYPDAMLAFSSFVEKYPDHALAGSAQYHVGSAYFKQGEYKLALQEFKRVLMSYDRSSHISHAIGSMVETEEKLGMSAEALRHRQILTSVFPQSPAMAIEKETEPEHKLDTPPTAPLSALPETMQKEPMPKETTPKETTPKETTPKETTKEAQ